MRRRKRRFGMAGKAVIAGAGPAGLTCAIYLARADWDVHVFTGEEMSMSCLAQASKVYNYPGFPDGIDGLDLLELFTRQAENCGATIHPEAVACIDTESKVVLDSYNAKHPYDEVVMASGVRPREFACDGIENIPVHMCAVCDGSLYGKDSSVVVIGGGDTAVNTALYLSGFVGKVYVVVRKDYMRATNRKIVDELVAMGNVDIRYLSNVVAVPEKGVVRLDNGGDLRADALFPCIGFDVNEIATRGDGKVLKGGDCVEEHHQVAVAVGSGARAALGIMGTV